MKLNIEKYPSKTSPILSSCVYVCVCLGNNRQDSIYHTTWQHWHNPLPAAAALLLDLAHTHIKWLISGEGSNYKQANEAIQPRHTPPLLRFNGAAKATLAGLIINAIVTSRATTTETSEQQQCQQIQL